MKFILQKNESINSKFIYQQKGPKEGFINGAEREDEQSEVGSSKDTFRERAVLASAELRDPEKFKQFSRKDVVDMLRLNSDATKIFSTFEIYEKMEELKELLVSSEKNDEFIKTVLLFGEMFINKYEPSGLMRGMYFSTADNDTISGEIKKEYEEIKRVLSVKYDLGVNLESKTSIQSFIESE